MPSPVTDGRATPVDRIVGFGRLLRLRGIPVSQAEVADALRAIDTMPSVLSTREAFAATLASTMVKCATDLNTFRTLFSLWFDPVAPTSDHEHHHHNGEEHPQIAGIDLLPQPGTALDAGQGRHEHGEKIDMRRYFGEGIARPEHDHHAEGRLKVTWLGSELHYDQSAGAPPSGGGFDGGFSLRRVSTTGQPGELRPPSAFEIPRAVVLSGMHSTVETVGPRDPDEDLWRLLGEQSQRFLRAKPLSSDDLWPAVDGEPVSALPDLKWDQFTAEDMVRLNRAINRLGRTLGGALGSRHAGRRGRLDARRTSRRAYSTGGVPFKPVYQQRRDDRPRLVILCDASLSVRGAAGFLLGVSQAAQRQSGRVRTFVFVQDVREVTLSLEQLDLVDAIRTILAGRIIDTSEASDGGAALADLLAHHRDAFGPKTSLLVLGDARNNGRDPNLAALAELRQRCRRIIWLTPEQRGTWQLAGCDLPRYAAHCDLIATVRTPRDLERVVAQLQK